MSGESLNEQRPQNIRAGQEGHAADPSEYALTLSADDMYLTLRALSRFGKQKRTRYQALRRKFGSSVDGKLREEADHAYAIVVRIHALTGGRFRYEARNTGG